jgi:hypothetical protein
MVQAGLLIRDSPLTGHSQSGAGASNTNAIFLGGSGYRY